MTASVNVSYVQAVDGGPVQSVDCLDPRPSAAVGVGQRFAYDARPMPRNRPRIKLSLATARKDSPSRLASITVGVGIRHEEPSVAEVRGADAGSRDTIPLCIIPERGQGPENTVKSPAKDRWDVLHDDEAGSKLANDARELEEESRPFAVEALRVRAGGLADVLAGEAADEDIARG